jgi:hypothetical protein
MDAFNRIGADDMKLTQGDIVIRALKRRPHTYSEMLDLGAGNSPWKRCDEALGQIRHHGWHLVKGRRWVAGHEYLTTWAVRRKP